MAENESEDPSGGEEAEAPPPAPTPAPRKKPPFLVCCGLVLIGIAATFAGGVWLARQVVTPEERALARAMSLLNEARALSGPEREAKLREALNGLQETRIGKAGPREQKLIRTLTGLLGEATPENVGKQQEKMEKTLDELWQTRRNGASAREREMFDTLRGLVGGEPSPPPGPSPTPAPVTTPTGPRPPPEDRDAKYACEVPRKGQWVLLAHTTQSPAGEPLTRYTYKWVAGIEGRLVKIGVQELERQELTSGSEPPYETFAEIRPLDSIPGTPTEQVEVPAGTFNSFKIERTDRQGRTVTTWTSFDPSVYFNLYVFVRQVTKDAEGREIERHELFNYGETGGGQPGTNTGSESPGSQ